MKLTPSEIINNLLEKKASILKLNLETKKGKEEAKKALEEIEDTLGLLVASQKRAQEDTEVKMVRAIWPDQEEIPEE